jgi:hypothetical protein
MCLSLRVSQDKYAIAFTITVRCELKNFVSHQLNINQSSRKNPANSGSSTIRKNATNQSISLRNAQRPPTPMLHQQLHHTNDVVWQELDL